MATTSGYADYSKELLSKYAGSIVTPQKVIANDDNFKDFGVILDTRDVETALASVKPVEPCAPVAHGPFIVRIDSTEGLLKAHNQGVKTAEYTTARFTSSLGNGDGLTGENDSPAVLVREVNCHPDGPQLFVPVDGQPFALLLGRPSKKQDELKISDLIVFAFDGSKSAMIHTNTWHQPPYGVGRFYTAQAASHECVVVDFLDQHSQLCQVPVLQ